MAYSDIDIEKIFSEVVNRIFNGESLRAILRDSHMPSSQTFYNWLDSDNDKSKRYARACEARADAIFDEILDIADETSNDTVTTDTGEYPNTEWINRSRLKVDSRKWIVSKLNPKKYGDKIDVNQNVRFEQPIFTGIDLDVTNDV